LLVIITKWRWNNSRDVLIKSLLEMIEDLVEAILPLFKVGGSFTEILYLLLLPAVPAFLVLELLFEEGIRG
jgi:hypothetical protein